MPPPRLKVSREGVILIKSFEGFRPRAVQEEDGRWVIGYGHTASAREGLTVAEADAELLLQYDLLPVVKALNERVEGALNQHQFDALASFAVSVGVDRFMESDVLQRLNEGQAGQAADAMIGWPEDVSADDRLRRRAAERALFVADPSAAVTLAELLSAPLPPPPVEPAQASEIQTSGTDSRAAAVAALLGEASDSAEPETGGAGSPGSPGVPAFEPPASPPMEAASPVSLDRYSPYAATVIGPLPGTPPTDAFQPSAVEPEPETGPEAQPAQEFEPVPGAETGQEAEAATIVAPTPVTALESTPPGASPFPPMESELVLTPATEADFVEPERPAWPSDQRTVSPDTEETVLFEDEPTLSVLRHEVEPAGPRRFDWSETGAFMIMGGVGLAACGASAAAFRLAVEQPSPMGETTVIAWTLAVIGVICVGVSSWNLYVRWGKPD